MNHPNPQTITTVVTAIVIALVLALRIRGMRRARPLKLERLWIVPAIYAAVFVVMVWEYPPVDAMTWVWLAAAMAAGAALGWRRGKLMRISVDPATHALNHQASPAALLFIVLLIAVRQGLRYEGAALGLNVFKVTGLLTAFAVGLFAATRAEMYLRARRLLAAARAG